MTWLPILLLLLLMGTAPVAAQNVPRVTITTPTAAATYTTTTSPLFLAGTARDNRGVTQVHWSTDRGDSGLAQGTTRWSASIPLQAGVTRLTITAQDAEQHQGTDRLTVTLMAPPPLRGPITVEWRYSGAGEAFQMERCVAPLPCSMAPVATLAVEARSWLDTNVLATQDYCYRLAVRTDGILGPYSNSLCSP